MLGDQLALVQPLRPETTATDAVGESKQKARRIRRFSPDRDNALGDAAWASEPNVAFAWKGADDRKHVRFVPGALELPRLPARDVQFLVPAEQDFRLAVAVEIIDRQHLGFGQFCQPLACKCVEDNEVGFAVAVLILDGG
jgi:hypothetical protein